MSASTPKTRTEKIIEAIGQIDECLGVIGSVAYDLSENEKIRQAIYDSIEKLDKMLESLEDMVWKE